MSDRGVIVDFDFAAIDGASLLYETAKSFLGRLDGIKLSCEDEARYLAGVTYVSGLEKLFAAVKTKKTAAKAARELSAAFASAVQAVAQSSVPVGFRNFVKALSAKDVSVVIATRAGIDVLRTVLQPVMSENVTLFGEVSLCYGSVLWDSWRRACVMNGLSRQSTIAVTGSGYGVKSALVAGMGALAVVNEHVAYQDFTGADAVVDELNSMAAKTALRLLRVS